MSPPTLALVLLACAVIAWPRDRATVLVRLRRPAPAKAGAGLRVRPHRVVTGLTAAAHRVVRAALRVAFDPARLRRSAIVVGSLAGAVTTAVAGWAAGGVAGLAAGVGVLLTGRAAASAEEGRRVDSVIEAVTAVAAELRAGQPIGATLVSAADSAHPWVGRALRGAAATSALGGSVPDALTEHARSAHDAGTTAAGADPPRSSRQRRWTVGMWRPGRRSALRRADDAPAAAMRRLAAAWRLCERSGASLADILEALESDLRARRAQDRLLAGLLAGPKATGALLAGLPALGLLMGSAMGADPWHVLTETPTGHIVLIVGIALETLGLLWTTRIVAGARPMP